MDFKLPHDVVSTCAKRDKPPSRRRHFRFFLDQNHILTTNSSERWPTSARHSVSSVYSVDCKKFVCIRVHSWLIINNLRQMFCGFLILNRWCFLPKSSPTRRIRGRRRRCPQRIRPSTSREHDPHGNISRDSSQSSLRLPQA